MRRSREEVFHIILGETTKTASTSFIKIIKKDLVCSIRNIYIEEFKKHQNEIMGFYIVDQVLATRKMQRVRIFLKTSS